MALAFDASANGPTGASPLTWTHTCTGSNLVLLVYCFAFGGDNVTSVTYNGVALTQLTKVAAFAAMYYVYALAAPATGAHSVVVTTSSGNALGVSVSYTGAAQSGLPDQSTTNTQASGPTTFGTSVTPVAANCWVVSGAMNNAALPTVNTNLTSRNSASSLLAVGDSNAAVTAGVSYTQTWNVNTGGSSAIIQVSLAPFVASLGRMFSVF